MRKTVPYIFGPGRVRPRRLLGQRRARIPGMPWFKCFTNRWFHARFLCQRYNLTEASTGLIPASNSSGNHDSAIFAATRRLESFKRPFVLGTIAAVKAGLRDRKRIPQRYKLRTR